MNVFDTEYWHLGGEQAEGGNDFTQRSKGYRNSLIPTPGRNFMFTLNMSY